MKHVYPVDGRYLTWQPHIEHDCDDSRCLDSGAFTTDPPPKPKRQPTSTDDPPNGGSPDPEE